MEAARLAKEEKERAAKEAKAKKKGQKTFKGRNIVSQAENTQDEPASGLTVNNDDTGFSPDYILLLSSRLY
jgi:hypothetical protein